MCLQLFGTKPLCPMLLWNTVYLERVIATLREHGITIDEESLAYLSLSDGNTRRLYLAGHRPPPWKCFIQRQESNSVGTQAAATRLMGIRCRGSLLSKVAMQVWPLFTVILRA